MREDLESALGSFKEVIRQLKLQMQCFGDELTNFLHGYLSSSSIVGTFATSNYYEMNEIKEKIKGLFDRIPRRHTPDNVKEMYNILDTYEDLLKMMEADERYEKLAAPFFETLHSIRATVKKSNDNKAAKRTKDVQFDEASGALKDTIEELMQL